MKVIVGPRGSGKTAELIEIAHETDQYIVEPTSRRARDVFRLAKEMGLPIRYPVTPHELLRTPLERTLYGRHHNPGGVLIDDAQDVLEQVLRCGRIGAVTVGTQDEPLFLVNPPIGTDR